MGSVYSYETATGERRYRILYRRPDNTQTSERGFKRKRDAEQRLAEVEVSKHRGEYIDPSDSKATIADLGAAWLADHEHVMKPSAYRPLESAWRVHVEPKWGGRAVGGVRHSEVQAWVSGMAKERSASTVLRAYGALAGILDQAVQDRRLARNVARGVKLPRKPKAISRVYLDHDQVDRLAIESAHPALVLTLAYTGLRWGEATALRVRHVDRKRRRLHVEENAVLAGGILHVGTPKTHEKRTVPYPAFLDDAIANLSAGKSPDGILFGDGVSHMRLPNSVRGWFSGAVDRIRAADEKAAADAKERDDEPPAVVPRVTPHDLRHTAASLAISAGANVKAVQRMLGHASAAMTLDTYADLFDDDLDGVAEALDQAHAAAAVARMLPPAESEE